jgi:hypothetical protein
MHPTTSGSPSGRVHHKLLLTNFTVTTFENLPNHDTRIRRESRPGAEEESRIMLCYEETGTTTRTSLDNYLVHTNKYLEGNAMH